MLAVRAGAAAAGVAAAQRHRLPVEPPGVRRGERAAAPAGGEPGAAGRTDRRRCDGQRGVLLRRDQDAVHRRAPGLDEDELRRGAVELRRRRPAAGSTSMFYWPGFGEVPWDELLLRLLLPLADEGLARWGVSMAVRDRYLLDRRGAVQEPASTARGGRRRRSPRWRIAGLTGTPRSPRCSGSTPRACTPMPRCTPGRFRKNRSANATPLCCRACAAAVVQRRRSR